MKEESKTKVDVDINGIKNRIDFLKVKRGSGNIFNLSDNQKYLYDVVKKLSDDDKSKVLQSLVIEKSCGEHIDFRHRGNVITDFCYNKVNKEDNVNKFLISPRRGYFQFVGFNWKNEVPIDIKWYLNDLKIMFTVGVYENGEFKWNFSDLERHLDKIIATQGSALGVTTHKSGIQD
jgi:hypothetical protein